MSDGSERAVLQVDRIDAVATITLNRPADRGNALTAELKTKLLATLTQVSGDEGVHAVVLTGAGTAFCAGQDLAEHAAALGGDPATAFATIEEHSRADRRDSDDTRRSPARATAPARPLWRPPQTSRSSPRPASATSSSPRRQNASGSGAAASTTSPCSTKVGSALSWPSSGVSAASFERARIGECLRRADVG